DVHLRTGALAIRAQEGEREGRGGAWILSDEGIVFERGPLSLALQGWAQERLERRGRKARLGIGARIDAGRVEATEILRNGARAVVAGDGAHHLLDLVDALEGDCFEELHGRIAEPGQRTHAIHGPRDEVSGARQRGRLIANERRALHGGPRDGDPDSTTIRHDDALVVRE